MLPPVKVLITTFAPLMDRKRIIFLIDVKKIA
jgi:hypothetical protein